MENDRSKRTCQFLVRLWTEDIGAGEREWRGKAQNIATGEFGYFRDWPGLVAAIQKLLEQHTLDQEKPHAEA